MDSKIIEDALGVLEPLIKNAVKELEKATKGMSKQELDSLSKQVKETGMFTDEELKDIEKFGIKL